MPISRSVKEAFGSSSLIRKMFEEGIRLKKQYGNDNVYDFSLGNIKIVHKQVS
jgi:aspartate aminotransferase